MKLNFFKMPQLLFRGRNFPHFFRVFAGICLFLPAMAFIPDRKDREIKPGVITLNTDYVDVECCDENLTPPMTDREILMDLYNATDGPHWIHQEGWGTGSDICTWYGVGCDLSRRITYLALQTNNLVGTLSVSLGSLITLQSLSLYGNKLTGYIPSEIGNLINLKYLSFFNNHFQNEIPASLGQLRNLVELNLSNNQLSGSIPTSIGNLSNLETLNLFGNSLSGSLPMELSHLNNLKVITVGENHLTGDIPVEIGRLNNLKELLLARNSFSGPIPDEIGNMSHLERLLLNENQLTGVIPNSLSRLLNLKHLMLFNNKLTGTIPPELGLMTNLSAINLRNNRMVGCFPNSLHSFCNQLIQYDFSHNPGLPGGGDFASFCFNGTGGYPCDSTTPLISLDCATCSNTAQTLTRGNCTIYRQSSSGLSLKAMLLNKGWQVCADAYTTNGHYCLDWKPVNNSIQFRRSAILNHMMDNNDDDMNMMRIIPSTLYDAFAPGENILHVVVKKAALDGFHPYDGYNYKLLPTGYSIGTGTSYHDWVKFELDRYNIINPNATEAEANKWLQCTFIPTLKTHISTAINRNVNMESYFHIQEHIPLN